MKAAWVAYRKFNSGKPFSVRAFAYELRLIWSKAKMAACRAAQTQADKVREAISVLRNKSKLTAQDYAQIEKLNAELKGAA